MTDIITYRTKNINDIYRALDDIYNNRNKKNNKEEYRILFNTNNTDYILYNISYSPGILSLRFNKEFDNTINAKSVQTHIFYTLDLLLYSVKNINIDNSILYSDNLLEEYEILINMDDSFNYTDAIKDILTNNNTNKTIILRTIDFGIDRGEYINYIDCINNIPRELSIMTTPILKDSYSIEITAKEHKERYSSVLKNTLIDKDILKRAVKRII